MSIASEIERLQTAKGDLKTSIEGKGVTVPEGATLDDYPALVDSISGGGLMVVPPHMRFSQSYLDEMPAMDFSQRTDLNNIFRECLGSFPENYTINCSSATNVNTAFYRCYEMITAPSMDFTNVTSMVSTFDGCRQLQNIPVYDTSQVTSMSYLFMNGGGANLTDESLNNLMTMCINAVNIPSNRGTLSDLYISQNTATRCQSLSNYQAFLDAGWTTGY